MHARMVIGTVAPARLNEAIQQWRSNIAPSAKQQKGFAHAYLLVQRQSGKVASISLWKSEADVQRSVTWSQQQVASFAGFFSTPPSVEQFEVAVEA